MVLVTPMINVVKVFDEMTNRDFGEITSPEVCSFPSLLTDQYVAVLPCLLTAVVDSSCGVVIPSYDNFVKSIYMLVES